MPTFLSLRDRAGVRGCLGLHSADDNVRFLCQGKFTEAFSESMRHVPVLACTVNPYERFMGPSALQHPIVFHF